jgi:alpha-mannosidase
VNTYIFHLIAHTHWDREWYLPRAAFHARLIPMIDELIERLHADNGFRSFLLDGQTVILEDYVRARPERETELKALVKTGRLQVGPCYVLADELIPSGESLIRNLLLGSGDADRFGGRLDVLYSPDAFGHPAVLPSLAQEFGIKYSALWRGLGGEPGQERDFFRWKGLDGQDVLVWHMPPEGYELGVDLPGAGADLPERWARVRAALVDRAAGKHIPVFVGADHHAPHPMLVRLRDLLAEIEPASAFRISRLDEFFQAAEATAARNIAGELRWSYGYTWTLQSVHSTRAPLKRRHGEVELLLERYAEPLATLARHAQGSDGVDRRPLLEIAWRTLVRTQFHDTLAGCAADEVAYAMEQRLTNVAAYASEIARGSLYALVGHDADVAREHSGDKVPTLIAWNPAARPRGGIMVADVTFLRRDVLVGPPSGRTPRMAAGYEPFALYDQEGTPLPVQVLSQRVAQERTEGRRRYPDQDEVDQVRVAFRAPVVPGLGIRPLTTGKPVELTIDEGKARVRARSVENRFVEVTLEPNGAVTLQDRVRKERYEGLLELEDGGDIGDAYTYCPPERQRVIRSEGPVAVRRVAAGSFVAALEARWTLTAGIDARLLIQLHADSPIIRLMLEIDNRNSAHRLRARLPVAIAGAATAGSAFGVVRRAPVTSGPKDYPRETPVRTAPAHRFVAAARDQRGLALLAPAFFEYEWTERGELFVTLLRAIGDLSRADLVTRPGHAGWPTPIPAAQCVGRTRIPLAIAPITEPEVERGDVLPALWEDAFLPLSGTWIRDAETLAVARETMTLEGEGLVFSSLKPAQIGSPMVLRCYNATGRTQAGAWRFEEGIRTAHKIRADEREAAPLVLEQRGRLLRFVAKPHEIISILVT